MNILFICDEYPPQCTGGIGTATKTVAEGLACKGHNVFIVGLQIQEPLLPKESIINGVKIYRPYFPLKVPTQIKRSILYKIIYQIYVICGISTRRAEIIHEALLDFIKIVVEKNKIELIEIPDYTVLTKYVLGKKYLNIPNLGIPVVGRIHGCESFLSYHRKHHIPHRILIQDQRFLQDCDYVLSVSEYAKKFTKDILNITKPITVIHNPISLKNVSTNHPPEPINKEILFIGKLTESKGAFNVISAFNAFSHIFPDYMLRMIGGGDIATAKSYSTSLTSQKIHFTGMISREKVYEYIDNAAFAVIPSYFETLGQAALEIMSRGKILIYTNTATGAEIIDDGVDGFLVNPFDVEEIIEKMRFVASNLPNLTSIGRKALEKVTYRFSEEVIVKQLENQYQIWIKEYEKYHKEI